MSITFQRDDMEYVAVEWDADMEYWIREPVGPTLNVSNSNAFFLMDLLGLEKDYCGSMSGHDLLGRVLVAQALYGHDEGVPPRQLVPGESFADGLFGPVREGGATFLDMGRSEGYADDRLESLRMIAEDAMKHGKDVCWA